MSTIFHSAESRGYAHHGWLETYHTFSFARYFNPERMNFGVLRVLNDDKVVAGEGFGRHGHDNMEIISIPLEGTLVHEDSLGTKGTIKKGEIQIMSAGSGIIHSESNNSSTEPVEFLQIWILPKHRDITPLYDQRMFGRLEKTNTFKTIVSPDIDDESLWINQDAYISIGEFTVDKEYIYTMKKPNNGLYMFIINGNVKVEDRVLHRRDGFGITEKSSIKLEISKDSTILLIDIPLN